jgi:hypothetical protein
LIVWIGLLLLRRWAAILFCGVVGFQVLCDLYRAVDMAMSYTLDRSEALLVGVEVIALAVSVGVLHLLGPRFHPGL